MNRLDRALGILLLLRQGKTISATELADRFEVSVRTIYRDMEALSELGTPIYAELGRSGGFRLVEGYFLPPVMFTRGEATSLLLGLTLLRRLRVTPYPGEIESAEHKLLAALPDPLRALLARSAQLIGFEELPPDTFHWGPPDAPVPAGLVSVAAQNHESQVVNTFLRALLAGEATQLRYRSPYQGETKNYLVTPGGLLWDRNWWYLVGQRVDQPGTNRLWRADRVLAIEARLHPGPPASPVDVTQLLGRNWLRKAMTEWIEQAPVTVRISAQQAVRLQADWYYRHAHYQPLADGQVLMCFGEDRVEVVLELVRWLGPGAELIEPQAWRAQLRAELLVMAAALADLQ
jgi:predicted DNA-binding transcriptional regulator YafY